MFYFSLIIFYFRYIFPIFLQNKIDIISKKVFIVVKNSKKYTKTGDEKKLVIFSTKLLVAVSEGSHARNSTAFRSEHVRHFSIKYNLKNCRFLGKKNNPFLFFNYAQFVEKYNFHWKVKQNIPILKYI